MNRKLANADLTAPNQQIIMTSFVRRFTPQNWWKHLTPSMVQLWAHVLLRSAFGAVGRDLFTELQMYGKPHGGVGTWFRGDGHVCYVWREAGAIALYELPEWHIGLWRQVTNAFLHNTAPHADWTDEFEAEDINGVADFLRRESLKHHVFEGLGILGSTWEPDAHL